MTALELTNLLKTIPGDTEVKVAFYHFDDCCEYISSYTVTDITEKGFLITEFMESEAIEPSRY